MSDIQPTSEEVVRTPIITEDEANEFLWQNKDTLRNMTSKYNGAVSQFQNSIQELSESSQQVNEATEKKFSDLQTSVDNQFKEVSKELSKKIESVTAADVGLGSVDNTSDKDKPVSTAQQKAIDDAIDKFASEFTEEIPGEEPIGDDPEVSTPVKSYIDEQIKDAVSKVSIGIASKTVLGGMKASDDITVDPKTGVATVPKLSQLDSIKESLNSNNQATQKVIDNQGTIEELQTEDKSSLVGAINEVFQLGSERKATLVENLTAMGVTCSTTEDWPSLLAKVLKIATGTDTSSGDLVAANLLYGKIGFGASGKVTGSMPNRSITPANGGQGEDIVGVQWPDQAISHSTLTQYAKYGRDGTEKLIMRPPTGYYDGAAQARVYANPNEVALALGLTAEKLVKGKTVCGVTGTGASSASSDITFVEIDRANASTFNSTPWDLIDLLEQGFNAIMMVAYPTYDYENVVVRSTGSLFWYWSDLYERASEIGSGYKIQPLTLGGTTYGQLHIYNDKIIMVRPNSSYGLRLFGIKNMDELL